MSASDYMTERWHVKPNPDGTYGYVIIDRRTGCTVAYPPTWNDALAWVRHVEKYGFE